MKGKHEVHTDRWRMLFLSTRIWASFFWLVLLNMTFHLWQILLFTDGIFHWKPLHIILCLSAHIFRKKKRVFWGPSFTVLMCSLLCNVIEIFLMLLVKLSQCWLCHLHSSKPFLTSVGRTALCQAGIRAFRPVTQPELHWEHYYV